ncbi:hypothetical protein RchiOBHm_Chr2g0124871 [Rosa chinensis]|uniref:Uncharacterized protein n=1 Tax=Rosa chinensis TaxID=74649 RepID=A0A2P6RTG8_ROSCH|nr:hypothetical protein RchiOBHm_Chr2g0124871 [Rosa chinensis]
MFLGQLSYWKRRAVGNISYESALEHGLNSIGFDSNCLQLVNVMQEGEENTL